MIARPKIILLITGFLAFFILVSLTQEVNRQWRVQNEIEALETDIAALETTVTELQHLNQYFQTSNFIERIAREKLNYKAAGEHVVLIPETELESPEATQVRRQGEVAEHSNPYRWWVRFFGA